MATLPARLADSEGGAATGLVFTLQSDLQTIYKSTAQAFAQILAIYLTSLKSLSGWVESPEDLLRPRAPGSVRLHTLQYLLSLQDWRGKVLKSKQGGSGSTVLSSTTGWLVLHPAMFSQNVIKFNVKSLHNMLLKTGHYVLD